MVHVDLYWSGAFVIWGLAGLIVNFLGFSISRLLCFVVVYSAWRLNICFVDVREKGSTCIKAGPPQSCLENCDILLSSRWFFLSNKRILPECLNTNLFQKSASLLLLFWVLNKRCSLLMECLLLIYGSVELYHFVISSWKQILKFFL